MSGRIAGHLWTVGPRLLGGAFRRSVPRSEPWSLDVADPRWGEVRLSGHLSRAGDGRRVALLLHGLGGSADSPYLAPLATALAEAGWTSLRLHLRGADRSGAGLHHAGFVDDLPAVTAAAPIAGADRFVAVGFSLGGHVLLRWLAVGGGRQPDAAITICSPLDLDAGARSIDRPGAWAYRRHLLGGMNEVYAAVAARHAVETPLRRVQAARTIREWDGLVVAPHFGFASAEAYYDSMSVGPRLGEIETPTWMVLAENDPMVPAVTVRPALTAVPPAIEVTWSRRGGHCGFPSDLDLGQGGERGLAGQVVARLGPG